MKILINEQLSPHKFKTPEGYLVCVDSILARTGKQTYTRGEVFGLDCKNADSNIDVDRTADEVFSEKTIASFENKPITIEHPDENVNSENWKEYQVGFVRDVKRGKTTTGEDVLLGTLVIQDKQAIDEIENGEHTELSCGYDCDINDDANPCQRNIRGNHVALCQQGRAGIARIVDSVNDNSLEPTKEMYDFINKHKDLQKKVGELVSKGIEWNDAVRFIYLDGKKIYKDSSDPIVVDFKGNSHLVEKLRLLAKSHKKHEIRGILENEADFNPKMSNAQIEEAARELGIVLKDSIKDSSVYKIIFYDKKEKKNKFWLCNATSYDDAINKFWNMMKDDYSSYNITHMEIQDSIHDVDPKKGESKEDFISRFMSETKSEYPDEKQRLAVAYSYWNKKDSIGDESEKDIESEMNRLQKKADKEAEVSPWNAEETIKKINDLQERLERMKDTKKDNIKDEFDKEYAKYSLELDRDFKNAKNIFKLGGKTGAQIFTGLGYKRDGDTHYKKHGAYTKVIKFDEGRDDVVRYYVLKNGKIPQGWTFTKTTWFDSKKVNDAYFIVACEEGDYWYDNSGKPNSFNNAKKFKTYNEADSWRRSFGSGSVQKITW